MTRRSQALVLTLLGVVAIELVTTGAYLRYVNPYMKWPVLLTGVLLLGLSLTHLFAPSRDDDHDPDDHSTVPRATWALVLPVFVVLVISPPALGVYVAEHRPPAAVPQPADQGEIPPLPDKTVVPLKIIEFVTRAKWDARNSLHNRRVQLDGFATRSHGSWFLTRLATTCCAADATTWRVHVAGATSPPVGRWVRVTGVWRDPGGKPPRRGVTVIDAQSVTPIKAPRRPYT